MLRHTKRKHSKLSRARDNEEYRKKKTKNEDKAIRRSVNFRTIKPKKTI